MNAERPAARYDPARLELLRAFGDDPIAYSTLQRGLSYFDASYGYLAYKRVWGLDICLGPPVCAPRDALALLDRFLAAGKNPFFYYVRPAFAHALARYDGRRFYFCSVGAEKTVALGEGAPASLRAVREVRGALRKALRARVALAPADFARDGATLRGITARYLARKHVRTELAFVNRPAVLAAEPDVRAFVLERDDRDGRGAFGYAVLDPYFAGGRVRGYLLNVVRFDRVRLWGVYYALVALLADALARDGVAELCLGGYGLHRVAPDPALPRSPALDAQVRWIERHGARFYNWAALGEMKARLPGAEYQRYIAITDRLGLIHALALCRAAGLSPASMLRAAVLSRPAGERP